MKKRLLEAKKKIKKSGKDKRKLKVVDSDHHNDKKQLVGKEGVIFGAGLK